MINWIRDYIGTCAFDLIEQGDFCLIDARHLVDKAGNDLSAVEEIIDRGVASLNDGRKVVVACDFGVSRSNSIAVGIISKFASISFDEALSEVLQRTGQSQIKLEMMDTVRRVVSGARNPANRGAVLLTGSSGLIGASLGTTLMNKNVVVHRPTRSQLNLETSAIELACYCEAHSVSHIVHLAYPRIYTNPAALGCSLVMLKNVLDVCVSLNLRLSCISSWVVFSGYKSSFLLADDNLSMRPSGYYSDAKFLEETLVNAYANRTDLAVSIARLSPVYGRGSDRPRLLKTLYKKILKGEPIQTHRYRNGRPALDLVHLSDVVDGLSRFVTNDVTGVFHFGSGRLVSIDEIVSHLESICGKRASHSELIIDEDVSNILLDIKNTSRVLGWFPKTSFSEGLADTFSIMPPAEFVGSVD